MNQSGTKECLQAVTPSTTLQNIVSDSLALFSLEIIAKATPLLTFPFIARALGPANFGKVGFATSLAGFFGLLVMSGCPTYGTRESAQRPEAIPALIAQVTGARIVFAGIGYGLLMLFTYTLAPRDESLRALALCAGLGLFVGSIDLQWLFAGQSRMWTIALGGSVSHVLAAMLTMSLVDDPGDALTLVTITSLTPLSMGACLLFAAQREYVVPRPALHPRAWLGMLPASALLALASLMSLIYDQLDLVLLRYFRPDEDLGMYAAACRVMGLALSSIFFIGQVHFPRICRAIKEDPQEELRCLRMMWRMMFSIGIPITVVGLLLARPLTISILGEAYAPAASLVRLLMPNVMATALAIYFGGRLIHHRRERQYLLAVGSGAVSNVLLNLLFMPAFGASAAAVITVFSQLTVAGIAAWFSRELKLGESLEKSREVSGSLVKSREVSGSLERS